MNRSEVRLGRRGKLEYLIVGEALGVGRGVTTAKRKKG